MLWDIALGWRVVMIIASILAFAAWTSSRSKRHRRQHSENRESSSLFDENSPVLTDRSPSSDQSEPAKSDNTTHPKLKLVRVIRGPHDDTEVAGDVREEDFPEFS